MRSKFSLLLFISLCLLVFSGNVFGAKYLVVAPGQSWSAGTGITGAPVNQVAGVPFNVSIVATDDTGTVAFDSSGFSVTMTCNAVSLITPANTFQLNLPLGVTPNCLKYPVTVTLGAAVTGSVTISALPTGGGLTAGSVAVTSQILDHFQFNALVSPKTAGTQFAISVTAQTSVSATVTGFNGTAQIIANYPVIGPVVVTTVTFINGIFNGNITLYDATEANLTLSCTSTVPSATGTSGAFSVSAGAINRLVIIGPGQTFVPGTSGGNGRSGGSTSINQQTAGIPFYVTVYAVDAYYNTSTTAATIALGTTDTNSVISPASIGASGAPNAGRAIFTVTLKTVGSGSQSLTATSGVLTSSQDTVPMTYGTLNSFMFTQPITSKTAGQLFTVYATAVDLYNNTVTTFASTPSVSFFTGAVSIDGAHSFSQISAFSGGVGTFQARIYQRVLNASVKLTYLTATGTSNLFDVAPSNFTQLLFVAPGQTYDPGNSSLGGISGSPSAATAGVAYPIDVYATDDYGNKIGSVNDTVSLPTSDTAASINGVTPPANVSLSSGQATYNVIFRTGGIDTVDGTDTTTSGINDAFASINVQSTTLAYFEIANIPASRTSGQAFTPIVRARDQFGNIVTNYAGIVYLTSNTDYSLPFESTINITGTNAGQYNQAWEVTFTAGDAGVRSLTGYFYRATSYTAQIFASDNFIDTPLNHLGHVGLSSPCTVNPGSIYKLQVLPPGVEARPGTLDGENNTPTGQAQGSAFTNRVNICDVWWNVVTGVTDQITINTSDNANAQINGSNSFPASVILSNGTQTFTSSYALQSSAFQLRVDDYSTPSILNDFSPYISIYNIFNFSIKAPGGVAPIGNQTAGVPFTIQITAFQNFGVTATSFNSTVEISSANTDWDASNQCISPTRSITFTAGVAVMQVTMYHAWTNAVNGSGAVINVKFGSKTGQSSDFDLSWGPATGVMVLADGMSPKPGLKQAGIPGYKGYDGSPITVEAGAGHPLSVYYVDDNYNIVYSQPTTYCKLTSGDPLASIDGINMQGNNVYVTITAGAFTSLSGMVLRTVGVTGQQYITAESGGAPGNNTSPPINIGHTTFSHFGVYAPAGPVIAGVPFNITIQALDLFQNICNSLNSPNPFNGTANLQSTSAVHSMLPVSYPLSNGAATASVQLFKARDTNAHIIVDSSGNSGQSDAIDVEANEFKRLLVTATGMNRTNGIYTSGFPNEFDMYDTSRPPFYPNNTIVSVNDAAHTPAGYQFIVYSCDAYGNITDTADVLGQTITVVTNDAYAPPVTLTAIDSSSGQVTVNVIFHTAMPGMVVSASISNPQIQSFTTPSFTTIAGTPFGLQLLAPGLAPNSGSGFYDIPSTTWYNGVTGTPNTELSGVPFPVTIQSCDIYGNFTIITDPVRVISSAGAPSFPTNLNAFLGTLGVPDSGISTLTAQLTVGAPTTIQMQVFDTAALTTLNPLWLQYPQIYVTNGGSLEYRVLCAYNTSNAYTSASYTPYGSDGTNSITAVAAPTKFAFKVNVVDSVSGQPVFGATNNFALTAVGYPDFNTLVPGTLGIQQGTSSNGIFETFNQSFTNATVFRIRVSDLAPPNKLTSAYSPFIIMGANPNNVVFSVSAQSPNVKANTATNIIGRVIDGNGNAVTGVLVTFTVTTGSGVFDQTTLLTKNAYALTDLQGNATVQFFGGYINETNIIRGTYNGVSRYASVAVSLVNPVLGQVSNYPNPFRAGSESTNISYLLDADSAVNITIYNLFGDVVFTKSLSSGQTGAKGGIVNTFVWNGKNNKGDIVGNGGYICVVEATIDGAKKKMVRKIAVAK